jgi:hypothetical protein
MSLKNFKTSVLRPLLLERSLEKWTCPLKVGFENLKMLRVPKGILTMTLAGAVSTALRYRIKLFRLMNASTILVERSGESLDGRLSPFLCYDYR